jgi:hypothetical protein
LNSKLSNELDKLLVHIAALDHLAELEVALDTGQESTKLMEVFLLIQPLLPAQHCYHCRKNSMQKRLPRLLIRKQ